MPSDHQPCFQYAIPFPHRLLPSGRPVQQTPLYETLSEKGAQFGQIGGWERAMWFDRGGQAYDESKLSFRDHQPWHDAIRFECEGVRDAVGVMDHGGFTKYLVTGAGAEAFLNYVFCGTMPKTGRVKISYMLTHKGFIWSEATIAKLGESRYLLCGPTLAIDRDFDWLMSHCPQDGSVHIEKGYHGWGSDFGTEYTRYDANLEGFVNWNKDDFIGKDAVLKQSQSQPEWGLFGFVIDGDDADAHASDPIFQNGKWVGFVTSACTGFRIGKRIALGYVKTAEIQLDQSFMIEILGKQCRAEHVATSFYDPENLRLRS